MTNSGAGEIDKLMDELNYPLLIVTAADGGTQAGCLVGFATQCSLDPVRFLVCLSKNNRTYRVASRSSHLGVHLVPRSAMGLAQLFGGSTGDDVDKFAQCDWTPGPGGVPLLDGCPDRFVGHVLDQTDGGDHVAFFLDPVEWSRRGEVPILMFHDARHIEAGHPA